ISMVEGSNNAETLGLDPSIFNVTTDAIGQYNNIIGLNTDGSIRLYANRTDGEGNTLEISTLGDQIITSIKITYLAGNNTVEGETSGLITFGNAEGIALQLADIQSTTKEYTDLNVESFTIKNTTTGTKSGQIWISEIQITFIGESTGTPVDPVDPVDPIEGQFHETFETSTVAGSYTDGSFTGVNGVEWTFVHARNEDGFLIDGKGILLRRANEPSSLSATFANGVGEFSFEYRKAYTGASERTYSVDVTNNGETVTHVLPGFGTGGADDTIHTFELDLNLTGEVVIKVYATGADGNQQAVFDNFKWTEKA
ncbi:MAG TPA: hypothetical protein GX742_00690, partial [Acholeplasmataceae bacterium]|nr:hypothetical protein [Acholeplasmataceae bacterium]